MRTVVDKVVGAVGAVGVGAALAADGGRGGPAAEGVALPGAVRVHEVLRLVVHARLHTFAPHAHLKLTVKQWETLFTIARYCRLSLLRFSPSN